MGKAICTSLGGEHFHPPAPPLFSSRIVTDLHVFTQNEMTIHTDGCICGYRITVVD